MSTIVSPPPPNPSAIRLPITCGDCIFFSKTKLDNAMASCSGMGCASSRAPCLRYAPDFLLEAVRGTLEGREARKVLNAVPDTALASLAAAVLNLRTLRERGFRLGQLVYFNIAGQSKTREYVANYYKARIVTINKDNNLVLRGKVVTATINYKSVIDAKSWPKIYDRLVAKNAIFDPESPHTWERTDKSVFTKPEYRPDWLDSEISKFRKSFLEAKVTRQTHDYDSAPVKRGRGRPRKDGKAPKVKVIGV